MPYRGKLGRSRLEALVSVAWADRTLADEERKAAQAAAMGLGLVLPWRPRSPPRPTVKPIPPEDPPVERLNGRDRDLIFLCAAWMALADEGVEDPAGRPGCRAPAAPHGDPRRGARRA
ncbi:MAG: hypothetical protein M5U28_20120 [Sandaracinaceae bacterium]|nr:hypothetical protein [Sandaracinaceae bacterium]